MLVTASKHVVKIKSTGIRLVKAQREYKEEKQTDFKPDLKVFSMLGWPHDPRQRPDQFSYNDAMSPAIDACIEHTRALLTRCCR